MKLFSLYYILPCGSDYIMGEVRAECEEDVLRTVPEGATHIYIYEIEEG